MQGSYRQNLARECGDFLVRRSDGAFAYQLAVVVDDAEQGVNSVVRGVDLLCSTPQQMHLQDLLGLPHPVYAHVPLVVAERDRRLSKRDHDAALDALLARFKTPEGVIGHIAGITGLAASCDPATPEELLQDFRPCGAADDVSRPRAGSLGVTPSHRAGCRAARPGRQADPGRHPSPEALPRARPAAVARGQRPVNPLLPVSPLGAPVR